HGRTEIAKGVANDDGAVVFGVDRAGRRINQLAAGAASAAPTQTDAVHEPRITGVPLSKFEEVVHRVVTAETHAANTARIRVVVRINADRRTGGEPWEVGIQ